MSPLHILYVSTVDIEIGNSQRELVLYRFDGTGIKHLHTMLSTKSQPSVVQSQGTALSVHETLLAIREEEAVDMPTVLTEFGESEIGTYPQASLFVFYDALNATIRHTIAGGILVQHLSLLIELHQSIACSSCPYVVPGIFIETMYLVGIHIATANIDMSERCGVFQELLR